MVGMMRQGGEMLQSLLNQSGSGLCDKYKPLFVWHKYVQNRQLDSAVPETKANNKESETAIKKVQAASYTKMMQCHGEYQ